MSESKYFETMANIAYWKSRQESEKFHNEIENQMTMAQMEMDKYNDEAKEEMDRTSAELSYLNSYIDLYKNLSPEEKLTILETYTGEYIAYKFKNRSEIQKQYGLILSLENYAIIRYYGFFWIPMLRPLRVYKIYS